MYFIVLDFKRIYSIKCIILYRENTFDPEKSFQSGSQSTQIRLLQDKLTASLIGDAENCLIHAKTRMIPTSKAGYFEIEVLAEGDSGCVEIGLVTSNASDNSDKDVEALPLRQKSFYRYSSTGNKEGSPSVSENCSYGAKFGLGDVVGCALTKRREIFFTLNGGSFGTGFKLGQEEFDGGLHPCIGFSKRGWRIEANFGKKLFQFNLQGLHQKMTWSSIEKSKGIELSEGNLIAKMRANRFTRQLSTDMVLTGNLDAGLVHATNILKPSLSSPGYFEIKIIQEDQSNLFHIALMTPSTDLKVFKETVFCDHSYWLASSGEKNAHGTKWEEYTSLFGLNDVIGCGLTHDRKVFFTLNGDNLGVAFQITEPEFEEGMIPAIRLGKGCGIQANFGKQPFNFDFITYKDFQKT